MMESGNNVNVQRPEFGQMIDMNLSPWTQLYPPGLLLTLILPFLQKILFKYKNESNITVIYILVPFN